MLLSTTSFLFVLTAGVTIAYQLSFFFIAATFRIDTYTDLAGGSNFGALAILTFCIGTAAHGGDFSPRQIVVTLLVCTWAVRLSGFLFYRILKTTEDKRFDGIRDDVWKFAVFWVFQMLWVWIVSLPLTYLNSLAPETTVATATTATARDIAGWSLAAVGLVIEAVADQEKFSYRQDASPEKPRFLATGTWRYSRHPNYLGELMFWWGVFISCSSVFAQEGAQYGYLTVASPVFITALLLGGSGLPIVERTQNRKLGSDAAYIAYKASTPVLLPWPCGYASWPRRLKALVCFEWYDEPASESPAAVKSNLLVAEHI